jgi:hypothetical protein
VRTLGKPSLALGFVVLCAAFPQAASANVFTVQHPVDDPVLFGRTVVYAAQRGSHVLIERLDLDNRKSVRLFAIPPGYGFDRLRGGGGRLAVGIARDAGRRSITKVIALDSSGRRTFVATARARFSNGNPTCGRGLELEDVSEQGEVLVEESQYPCGRARPATEKIVLVDASNRHELIRRRPSREEPDWQLVGRRLLESSAAVARVRDLSTGELLSITPRRRGSRLGTVALNLTGHVALSEYTGGAPSFRARVRLLAPQVPVGGSRLLAADRNVAHVLQFCGTKLVDETMSLRGWEEVLVRDSVGEPPRTLLRRREPRNLLDRATVCDEHSYVRIEDRGSAGRRIEDLPLDRR